MNPDGTPLSPQVDPWAEFEDWNIRVRDYFISEEGMGHIYQERKEDVGGTFVPPSPKVLERNIHTYQQLKARMLKLDEFAKEFPDVY